MTKPRESHFVNALQAAAKEQAPAQAKQQDGEAPAAPEMRVSRSRAIESWLYDAPSKRLRVKFRNGSTFEYDDVPQHVGVEFERTDSHGALFGAAIRGKFKGRKV